MAETKNQAGKLTKQEIENYKKAGQIASQIKDFCRKNIKAGDNLKEIADKIESKIIELGGEVAFPLNLAINDIAAHYSPEADSQEKAQELLKIDIGVHIKGCIADTAISLDLTKEQKYKKLIQASESALANAIELVKKHKEKTKLNEIGREIHRAITGTGFSPIKNLSGHSLASYEIHSGIMIRNYDDGNSTELGEGVFAIEPFATTGQGEVYEGKLSTIYHIAKFSKPRDPTAREVLLWLAENKNTLPFSQRELEKKFGAKARLALRRLEEANIINSYPQLIEKSHQPVSQAETTLIVADGKVEILA